MNYTKRLDLQEIRMIQIDILNKFVEYCENNKINYFLGYGTLLGAIRHKGYIPWDDDIDVLMPRDDYKQFVKEFNKTSSDLEVFDISIDDKYCLPYAKLSDKATYIDEENFCFDKLGINIDIFPLDGVSSNFSRQKRKICVLNIYKKMFLYKDMSIVKDRSLYKNCILLLIKLVLIFFNKKNILKLIVYSSKQKKYIDSKYVGCLAGWYMYNEVMNKDIFIKSCYVEFEGKCYKAPYNYDEYLRNLYGNYMELPPKNKRKTHHIFNAYLR